MKDHDPLGISTQSICHLERTGRRRIAIHLGIALIRKDAEIMLVSQCDQRLPISAIRDRAFAKACRRASSAGSTSLRRRSTKAPSNRASDEP